MSDIDRFVAARYYLGDTLNRNKLNMLKASLNSKGFGFVAVLLAVVMVAIVGGSGAYVYHKNHKVKAVQAKTNTSNKKTTRTQTTPDLYAGWKTYALTGTRLSFKYPATWTVEAAPQCDGAQTYDVNAPASEVQPLGATHYGVAIIAGAEVAGTSKCAPSAASRQGIALGAKSQSQAIESGALKGKYAVINSAADGMGGIDVFNTAYDAGQKVSETGVLSVGGTNLQVTSGLVSGQNPASAATSIFVASQLYRDTLNILESLTAN